MILFPAIDLYEGRAVRLYKGRYEEMTVYSDHPEDVAADFVAAGCPHIHLVDLEGAKSGGTPNLAAVLAIKEASGAFCEIGGGVRSMSVIERYLGAGIDRVILGTAAVRNERLLCEAVGKYGEKIAVGADIRDGLVAVSGWTETSGIRAEEFFARMEEIGVRTVICTDIAKDGAMAGTNLPLYEALAERYRLNITASGGVSDLGDVERLASMGLYGAIIGKAYYTGAIDLREAARRAGAQTEGAAT
ncbi:MAG: 1-(5-phosphoribosyl)-5-[Clostridia bacterium]|nr:1-(5-phosphoribosyl)-5-[(5-phosphoribosylamino)methylideneamino]imidazole-4-carboxamide isomerase [Clostridia bacterium]